MVSKRARVGRSVGTVLNDLDTRTRSAESKARASDVDQASLEARLLSLESNQANLMSPAFRVEQERPLLETAMSLGTVDLNTVMMPGTYVQTQNANTSLSLNYPFERAGFLEVISNDSGLGVGILQRYTDYQGKVGSSAQGVWIRTWYNTWSAWTRMDAIAPTTQSAGALSVTIDATTTTAAVSGTISVASRTYDRVVSLQGSVFATSATTRVDIYLQRNNANLSNTRRVGIAAANHSVSLTGTDTILAGDTATYRMWGSRVGGSVSIPGDSSLTYLDIILFPA